MSKINETSAQKPDATHKAGCCGGDHEKGHRAQTGGKEQAKTPDTAHTAHKSEAQTDAGCCGGSKDRK